jgi:predicted nucleic acid-binding protein
MAFLLDTNVLSELRKGAKADANVRRWAATQLGQRHFVSVISLGEIRKGIERLRPKDPVQAEVLERWLGTLKRDFARDILPFTDEVADRWGRLTAGTPLPVTDSLLAATALAHGLSVATRNVADFLPCGVPVVHPFE